MVSKFFIVIMMLLSVFIASQSNAGDRYMSGYVSNMTSMRDGLLIMLDSGTPDVCNGTPYGWMIIPEENKTMVAVAMMAYMQKDRAITLSADGTFFGGYCLINQAHLHP